MPLPTVRVATAHISPHLLDTPATLQKTIGCIEHAAKHRASLVCFPESSIPGFPIWSGLVSDYLSLTSLVAFHLLSLAFLLPLNTLADH